MKSSLPKTDCHGKVLQRVAVIYPGDRRYVIADRVEAVPLSDLASPERLFGE